VEACYRHVHLIAGLGWPYQAGVETVMIPPRSLRANVNAERFLLTARTEATDCTLIFSERHPRSGCMCMEAAWIARFQRMEFVKIESTPSCPAFSR
jgi:hypothetical protein